MTESMQTNGSPEKNDRKRMVITGMRRANRAIDEAIAESGKAVFIIGEAGTGKRLAAQTIHQRSERGKRPFINVDATGLDDDAAEIKLFGRNEESRNKRRPEILRAEKGTIYLPHVEKLGSKTQHKILTVAQFELATEARVIASTTAEIIAAIRDRQLMRYLLDKALRVELPPLRNRGADAVEELAGEILKRLGPKTLDASALDWLCDENRRWPGNIAQLEKVLRLSFLRSRKSQITADDLRLCYPKSDDQITSKVQQDLPDVEESRTTEPTAAELEELRILRKDKIIATMLKVSPEDRKGVSEEKLHEIISALAETIETGEFISYFLIGEMTGLTFGPGAEFIQELEKNINEDTPYSCEVDESGWGIRLVREGATAPAAIEKKKHAKVAPVEVEEEPTTPTTAEEPAEDPLTNTAELAMALLEERESGTGGGPEAPAEAAVAEKPETAPPPSDEKEEPAPESGPEEADTEAFKGDALTYDREKQKSIVLDIFDGNLRGKTYVSAYQRLIKTLETGEYTSYSEMSRLTQLKGPKLTTSITEMKNVIERKTEFRWVKKGKKNFRLAPKSIPDTAPEPTTAAPLDPESEAGTIKERNEATVFIIDTPKGYEDTSARLKTFFEFNTQFGPPKGEKMTFVTLDGLGNAIVIKVKVTGENGERTFHFASNMVGFEDYFNTEAGYRVLSSNIRRSIRNATFKIAFGTLDEIDKL